jgi:hypothetical protein
VKLEFNFGTHIRTYYYHGFIAKRVLSSLHAATNLHFYRQFFCTPRKTFGRNKTHHATSPYLLFECMPRRRGMRPAAHASADYRQTTHTHIFKHSKHDYLLYYYIFGCFTVKVGNEHKRRVPLAPVKFCLPDRARLDSEILRYERKNLECSLLHRDFGFSVLRRRKSGKLLCDFLI